MFYLFTLEIEHDSDDSRELAENITSYYSDSFKGDFGDEPDEIHIKESIIATFPKANGLIKVYTTEQFVEAYNNEMISEATTFMGFINLIHSKAL